MTFNTLKTTVSAAVLSLALAAPAFAAGLAAHVNTGTVAEGDTFQLTLTAGDQVGSAGLPIIAALGARLVVNGLPVHGLLPASPARDAGNPATPTGLGAACQPTDQVGQTRPFDGGGGAFCDIGAIEETSDGSEPEPSAPSDANAAPEPVQVLSGPTPAATGRATPAF